MTPRTGGARRGRAAVLTLAIGAALVGAAPGAGTAATRLYVRNHVYSNDVRDLAAWNGTLAAATTGGLVRVTVSDGTVSLAKTLAAPGGLPSNRTLSVLPSPSGDLWIGTVDGGLARLTPAGGWRRTLTTFDGLPSNTVQRLLRAGDSVWVGTSGGVALFAENPANARVTLRRSDTSASTAGALVSDDVRALAIVGDTLWAGTGSGLAAFAAGTWSDRRAVFAGPVNALAAVGDTLWIGSASGPRAYAGGALAAVEPGHAGLSLALLASAGTLHSGASPSNVFRRSGGTWAATGPGLPLGGVQALGIGPDGRLWAGTPSGLARYDAGAGSWTDYRSEGPIVESLQKVTVRGNEAWFSPGNQTGPGLGIGFVLRTDGTTWSALSSSGTGGAMQPTSVFGILAARDGALWFGHCCGGGAPRPRVERHDPAAGTWIEPGADNIWSFAQAPDGRVYGAGVEHTNGVYVFDPAGALIDSLTPANTQGSARGAGLSSNDLRDIAFDPAGVAWIGTAESGVDRWEGRGTDAHADDFWDHYAAGFPSTSIRAVATVGTSAAYFGTEAGVAVLANGVIDGSRQNPIQALIGSVVVEDLVVDPRGIVWIGTAAGLARFDHASREVERFTTADGLADNDVRGLAWDEARGILWVATARGVSEVHPQTEGAPAIGPIAFVYPNPAGASAGAVRLGGLAGGVTGEIRDVAGRLVRSFRADPVSNAVWDLNDVSGSRAAPGVYLVIVRDGDRVETLRIAVTR